jgi:hypothetical protein
MMLASPFPYAVTIPADAPVLPPELELTGNEFGKEESQVVPAVFVTSLTVGAVSKVPIARKLPVSCNSPTVIELGMMVSEISPFDSVVPVVPPPVTVTCTPFETGPLNPTADAVIVAVPLPTADTSPATKPPVGQPATPDVQGPTTAMAEEDVVHVASVVMFCVLVWLALPYVPVAVN